MSTVSTPAATTAPATEEAVARPVQAVPPVADFRAPLSRSAILLFIGAGLVAAGWVAAILAFFVPIGYRFPEGALVFAGSGLFSLVTAGGGIALGVVALVAHGVRPARAVAHHVAHTLGRRIIVPSGIALIVLSAQSLVGEKVLAIVGLVH
jgi:hypothetical protein